MTNNDIDYDLKVLEEAKEAVFIIDKKYKKASFDEQLDLKDDWDKAFSTYVLARVKLLKQGVVCNADDVKEMQNIRKEVEQAAKTQSLIAGIFRFSRFFTKLLNI